VGKPIRLLVPALALVLLSLAALGGVRHNGFLSFDDGAYLTANPRVEAGLTAEGVRWALTTTTHGNWHPLTWLSHMADVSLFGLRPGPHHLVGLALHVMNALLLFLGLYIMTGARWRSAFVAALFAVHPLHVESVAWAAERKDLLCAFFGLLTLLLWVLSRRRPSTRLAVAATACYILGLLAKPMLVTLPFLFLLLDYWPLGRSRSLIPPFPLWREKAYLLVLAAVFSGIAFLAQARVGAMPSMLAVSAGSRVANALVSYSRYLVKTAVPRGLAAYYPLDIGDLRGPTLWVLIALPAALSLLVLRAAQRRPWAATGWFWYLGTLLPVIGFVQIGDQALADRYTYLPLGGIFLLVGWEAADCARRRRIPRILLAGAALAWILALVPLTRQQVSTWRDDMSLFGHALSVTRKNWMMENNMGVALAARGDLAGAVMRYQKSLGYSPHPLALNNLGAALTDQGRAPEAEPYLRQALKLAPRDAEAHYNLGVTLLALGRTDEALVAFREALRLDPNHADALYNVGWILAGQGKPDEAVRAYREAVRNNPRHALAYNGLGAVCAGRGEFALARQYFQEALRIQPQYRDAENNLRLLQAQVAPGR